MPSTTPNNTTKSIQTQGTLPSFDYSQDKQTYILPPPTSLPGYYHYLPSLEDKKKHRKSNHDDVSTAATTLASFASYKQEDDVCPEKQVIEVTLTFNLKKNFFLTSFVYKYYRQLKF